MTGIKVTGAIAGISAIAAAASKDVNVLNVILNVATLGGLVLMGLVFGPRAFKARQAQADIAEQTRTIAVYKQSHESFRERIDVLEGDVKACHEEIAAIRDKNLDLQRANAALQARSEAMQKYTAQEALNSVEKLLIQQEGHAQHRHEELIRALSSLAEAAGERRTSNLPHDE